MPDEIPVMPSSGAQQSEPRTVLILPADAVDTRPEIGVWGAPGTGKTMCLVAALRSLERISTANGHHYYVQAPHQEDADETQESIQRARSFLVDVRAAVDDNEAFPAPTEVNTKPFSLYLTLEDDKSGTIGRYHKLCLFDAAGEHAKQQDHNHPYWQHLRRVRVILLIVDAEAERTNQGYAKLITNFTNIMNDRDQSLAIIITKVDTRNPHLAIEMDGEALLAGIIGKDNMGRLFGKFSSSRRKIFATSAVGWCIDPNDSARIIPNISRESGDKTRLIRGGDLWRPYNLAYALAWAMDELEESRLRALGKIRANFIRRRRKTNVAIVEEYHARNRPTNGDDRLYYMP
jgi:hypothetical protein